MSQHHYPDILWAAKAMDILAGKEKSKKGLTGERRERVLLPEIDSVGVLTNNTRCWPQCGLENFLLSALKHSWGYGNSLGF
jgi:hypothetical protein